MIRSLIEDIDTDIVECSDGGQAVDAYKRLKPNWVLMDINMRPIDGFAALKTILGEDPEAKVVIVSQHQDAKTRDTALALGAVAFVGKDDLSTLPFVIGKEHDKRDPGRLLSTH
jgi:two-component system chemotaxis response regulator CheY